VERNDERVLMSASSTEDVVWVVVVVEGDLVVAGEEVDNFSMYEAVDGCLFSLAQSAGVFPLILLTFGSAPASMRALMISSGAPFTAAQCNAFHLYCNSVVCCVSFVINQCLFFN
jgi:hypothetical protein